MRAPTSHIVAPLFPTKLPWVNTNGAQASILQRGKPMLVEFWDFCRPNSIRTLPYVKEWHARYAAEGLRTVGVHCGGFEPSHDEQAVRAAVAFLGIEHPVLIDNDFEVWREYENRGWPARYLFDGKARLFEYHYGEGGYEETELAIQELLDVRREPLAPLRPEDAPDARLLPQTEEQPGAYSGAYEAGGVWAVLDGAGEVSVNPGEAHSGKLLAIERPGAYALVEHRCHTAGVLDLRLGAGVECLATCFTPGIAA